MAEIIDGKKIAEDIKREVRDEAVLLKESKGIVPGLAVILVGDNPASQSYVRRSMGFLFSFPSRKDSMSRFS